MFFYVKEEALGGNDSRVCYYKLCRDHGVAAKGGAEIPFGRLGLYPRRLIDELSLVASLKASREIPDTRRADAVVLSKMFREASGRANRPVVDLLFDAQLASRFRERCSSWANDPVGDFLQELHYGLPVAAQRGRPNIFPTRLNVLPAGSEAAIEWPLVRLWCESTSRPDNMIALLCQHDNAERFVAMSSAFLQTAVSGLSDIKRKVQVTKWALDLEQRRLAARRWLQSIGSLREEMGHRPNDFAAQWRLLGQDRVPRKPELRAGLVQMLWGGEPAWVGFSKNVGATLESILSGDLLKAVAAHGWWDVDPHQLTLKFIGDSELPEVIAASREIRSQASTSGIRRPSHLPSQAIELAMLSGDRPFLNLPLPIPGPWA